MKFRTALIILTLATFLGSFIPWTKWGFYHGSWNGHVMVNGKPGSLVSATMRNTEFGTNIKGKMHLRYSVDLSIYREEDRVKFERILGGHSYAYCDLVLEKPVPVKKGSLHYVFEPAGGCPLKVLEFPEPNRAILTLKNGLLMDLERTPSRDPILNSMLKSRYVAERSILNKFEFILHR